MLMLAFGGHTFLSLDHFLALLELADNATQQKEEAIVKTLFILKCETRRIWRETQIKFGILAEKFYRILQITISTGYSNQ